ncbi:hypothetical protein SVAN01_11751 [Stagonosporopsis vannaccii]|nr:hypothetical protein SVAN01_11751 [Stagonosporopsis vannaccii]
MPVRDLMLLLYARGWTVNRVLGVTLILEDRSRHCCVAQSLSRRSTSATSATAAEDVRDPIEQGIETAKALHDEGRASPLSVESAAVPSYLWGVDRLRDAGCLGEGTADRRDRRDISADRPYSKPHQDTTFLALSRRRRSPRSSHHVEEKRQASERRRSKACAAQDK